MADPPLYPTGTLWGTYVFVVVAVVLVLAIVLLHLTGVIGPRAHS